MLSIQRWMTCFTLQARSTWRQVSKRASSNTTRTEKASKNEMAVVEERDPGRFKALKEQLAARTKAHFAESRRFIGQNKGLTSIRDQTAVLDCRRRMLELDGRVRMELESVLENIDYYRRHLNSVELWIPVFKAEEQRCFKDSNIATGLAILGSPIDLFAYPPEIRGKIYSKILHFSDILSVTTFKPLKLIPLSGTLIPLPGRGKHGLWKHPLFSISKRLRNETASYYYGQNQFSCINLYSIETDLGLKILTPEFLAMLRSITLVWTNLGESTGMAVEVLKSLPGLRNLDIYISWEQILGFHQNFHRNTRTGVSQFKSLLALQNANPAVQNRFRVFKADLLDLDLHLMNSPPSQRINNLDIADPHVREMLMYGRLSARLIGQRSFKLSPPRFTCGEDAFDKIHYAKTHKGKGSPKEVEQAARLMTDEQLDRMLEEVMAPLRAEDDIVVDIFEDCLWFWEEGN